MRVNTVKNLTDVRMQLSDTIALVPYNVPEDIALQQSTAWYLYHPSLPVGEIRFTTVGQAVDEGLMALPEEVER